MIEQTVDIATRDGATTTFIVHPERGGPHPIVLFYMDRSPHGGALQTHPRGDASLPLTGVFATRGRAHPNPIGLAVVDMLARDDCVLTVRRLDAWHGTPVIDIKPYDHYDVYPDPRVPAWFRARLTA